MGDVGETDHDGVDGRVRQHGIDAVIDLSSVSCGHLFRAGAGRIEVAGQFRVGMGGQFGDVADLGDLAASDHADSLFHDALQ